MKVKDAIEKTNQLKANVYSEENMSQWLSELENYAIESVFNRAEGNDFPLVKYSYEDDEEKDLMIPDPYSEIYIYYLAAKIDYWNKELDSYNNNMSMYNASYSSFAAKYRREHMPKQTKRPPVFLH